MAAPQTFEELVARMQRTPVTEWLWALGVGAAAVLLGILLGRILARSAARLARSTESQLDDTIVLGLGPPIRWFLPVMAMRLALPVAPLPEAVEAMVGQLITVMLILLVGWLLLRVVAVVERVIAARVDVSAPNNLRARSVATQVRGFRNIARFLIGVLTLGSVLMTFEQVRRLGMSLLASAGVASIVIGFAAQRSIATVIAGIQIALSQPIRVDDVVIVEGEWGRIEEITLTYVVVKIWDQRRLVVPITYFIEKPFQNWTRTSAELLGTVFIHVDYAMPLEPLRAELARLLENEPLWDRRVAQIVVTEARERTLELRVLVSAVDASQLWDLRCRVREGLVDYIRREHPECLPTLRTEVRSPV